MTLAFYGRNAWWLATGFLLTFGSSFGQTFFIALFAGGFREEFGLTNGEWGGIYTVATLASAATLAQVGRLADTMPLVRLAGAIALLYALAASLMMLATGPVMLALAVFGLRFCGQGMMSHISMTAMARWFRANRARAIAISVLGFPLGEALLPIVAVPLIETFGWRTAWGVVAAVILLALLPLVLLLLSRERTPQGEGGGESAVGMHGRHWTRGEVLRSWTFWVLMPGILAPPFIGTCVFFHQVHISEVRDFSLATMALGFPLYAAIVVTTSFVAGFVVDKIGPTRLLPVLLLPLACAIPVLSLPGGVSIWFLTLTGVGVSQGVMITMVGSLWPTLYGTRWIGGVKALATSMMVVSTAAGPGITGWLIDLGITFPEQTLYLSAWCLVMCVVFAFVAPRLTRQLPEAPEAAPARPGAA
jgi:MFS family permease